MLKIYMHIIVPLAGILPIIVGVFRRKYWNEQARILLLYMGIAALFNLIAEITAKKSINNMPYLHLYTVLEFTVLSIYLRSFSKDFWHRLLFNSLIAGFLLLSLWYAFIKDRLFAFNEIPRFLDSLIISVFCLYYLLKDLGSAGPQLSRFQVLSLAGLLLYYSSGSVIFGLSGKLMHMPKNITAMLWNIHHTFLLVMYILFAIAFYSLKNVKR